MPRSKAAKYRKEDIAAAKLYRKTCLGKALEAALTTMSNEKKISEELYKDIMSDFDYEMITGFKDKVHTQIQQWQGHLCEYKQLDGVWNFHLKNIHLKTFPAPVSEDLFVKDLSLTTFKLEAIPKPRSVRTVKVEKTERKKEKVKEVRKKKKKKGKKRKKKATLKKKSIKTEKNTSKKRGGVVKKERILKKKATSSSAKRRPKVEKKKKRRLKAEKS